MSDGLVGHTMSHLESAVTVWSVALGSVSTMGSSFPESGSVHMIILSLNYSERWSSCQSRTDCPGCAMAESDHDTVKDPTATRAKSKQAILAAQ